MCRKLETNTISVTFDTLIESIPVAHHENESVKNKRNKGKHDNKYTEAYYVFPDLICINKIMCYGARMTLSILSFSRLYYTRDISVT